MRRVVGISSFLCLFAVACSITQAVTLTSIYEFLGSDSGDSGAPNTGIIQGRDGYLYGTTYAAQTWGGGVFKVSTNGELTVLCTFPLDVVYHGPMTEATLVEGANGHFYGTTLGYCCASGTIFEVSESGEFQILAVSGYQWFGLLRGLDSNFYGIGAGAPVSAPIYRITPSGTLTGFSSFDYNANGDPSAALVQDSSGNFYGVSYSVNYCDEIDAVWGGSIFRIGLDGNVTNLWWFSGPDGAFPACPLVQGPDGNFYGRTLYGGDCWSNMCEAFFPPFPQSSPGWGTIFKISPTGDFATLRSFSEEEAGGYGAEGSGPFFGNGLFCASDGKLYGMTPAGGTNNLGTIFSITTDGVFTRLWQFDGTDGANPVANLVQGCDGNLYGVTMSGGTNGLGTVFRLNVPFDHTPNQISSIQIVGSDVVVTVPSIFGEDYQLQYRGSMNTGTWSNIAGASVSNSIGGPITLTDFGGALNTQRFYRVDVSGACAGGM